MAERNEFRLQQGMSVVDREGNAIGSIDSILIENRSGRGLFLTVDRHLVPMDALINVEENRAQVGLSRDRFQQLPEHRAGQAPSAQDVQRACEIAGVSPPGQGRA